MTVSEARSILGVGPDSGPEDVRAAWRRAARVLHPDAGGDAAAFDRARQAYELLTSEGGDTAAEVAAPLPDDDEVADVWVVDDAAASAADAAPRPPRARTPGPQPRWDMTDVWALAFPVTLLLTAVLTVRAAIRLFAGPYYVWPGRFPWWGGGLYEQLIELFYVPGVVLAALVGVWGWVSWLAFRPGADGVPSSHRYARLRSLSYVGLLVLWLGGCSVLAVESGGSGVGIVGLQLFVWTPLCVALAWWSSRKFDARIALEVEREANAGPSVALEDAPLSERIPMVLRSALVATSMAVLLPVLIRATNGWAALIGVPLLLVGGLFASTGILSMLEDSARRRAQDAELSPAPEREPTPGPGPAPSASSDPFWPNGPRPEPAPRPASRPSPPDFSWMAEDTDDSDVGRDGDTGFDRGGYGDEYGDGDGYEYGAGYGDYREPTPREMKEQERERRRQEREEWNSEWEGKHQAKMRLQDAIDDIELQQHDIRRESDDCRQLLRDLERELEPEREHLRRYGLGGDRFLEFTEDQRRTEARVLRLESQIRDTEQRIVRLRERDRDLEDRRGDLKSELARLR